jgi:cytochrome c-type biogenesis protein CcmH
MTFVRLGLLLAIAGTSLRAQDGAPPAASASSLPSSPASTPGDPAFVVGAPKGPPLAGPALESRTEDVAALLRCPVCQGLSVGDSPASMAQNMKAEVRSLLARGYVEEQVLAYFERSYGEFVRLDPPLRGVNWLVWLGPLAGLLAGGAVVALTLRRAPASPTMRPETTSALPARDALPEDDRKLAEAVLRVRELAYGWPGGKPKGPSGS